MMTIRKARIPQAGAYNNKRLSFVAGRMENGKCCAYANWKAPSCDGSETLKLYVTCWVDEIQFKYISDSILII